MADTDNPLQQVYENEMDQWEACRPVLTEYLNMLKAKYTEPEHQEWWRIIPQLDLERIVCGYRNETEREEETISHIKLFYEELVNMSLHNAYLESGLTQEEFEMFQSIIPISVHGQDKLGHPIMYERIDQFDLAAAGEQPPEKLARYRNACVSAMWNRCHQETKKQGKAVFKHIHIFDVSGIGIFGARKYMDIVKGSIDREGNLFPETVYKLFIINSGWSFRAVWSIVSNFIHPVTYEKIKLVGGASAYTPALLELIDASELTTELGGENTEPLRIGGHWYSTPLEQQFANLLTKSQGDEIQQDAHELEAKSQGEEIQQGAHELDKEQQ